MNAWRSISRMRRSNWRVKASAASGFSAPRSGFLFLELGVDFDRRAGEILEQRGAQPALHVEISAVVPAAAHFLAAPVEFGLESGERVPADMRRERLRWNADADPGRRRAEIQISSYSWSPRKPGNRSPPE